MKFLNSNPNRKFRVLENLRIYGYSNYSDKKLLDCLKRKSPPNDIRGQFAYVYIEDDYWIACVDHFASTNLYYSDTIICPDYCKIVSVTNNLTNDPIFHAQKEIVKKAYTVGFNTEYSQIKRIMPEHRIENNKQIRYMDLINEAFDSNNDVLSDIETYCNRIEDPVIAFSGGRDSAFVAMALKHFDKNPRLVKIQSKNVKKQIDVNAVKDYENIGWDIEYFNIKTLNDFPEDRKKYKLWYHPEIAVKSRAVLNKGKIALSGEISGGITKSNKLELIYHNSLNTDPKIYIDYWINKMNDTYTKSYKNNIDSIGYDVLVEHYTNAWNRLDIPTIEKVKLLFHVDFASWRLWGESQDDKNSWSNLYGDYNLQTSFITTVNQNKKTHMKDIAKNFKSYTDISWNYPLTGMDIKDEIGINS